jgi:site-specific DNA-cytosine methylase
MDCYRLGLPQRRPRYYFVGYRNDLVNNAGMGSRLQELHLKLKKQLEADHPLMDIEEFLSADDDIDLVTQSQRMVENARLRRARASRSTRQKTSPDKWVTKHANMNVNVSMHASNWKPGFEVMWPEVAILPERDRQLLDIEGITFPTPTRRVFNSSQSRLTVLDDASPCITPCGVYLLGWKARMLRGHEAMALQGFWLPKSVARRYNSAFLQDLAGNAFSTPCVLAVTLMQFICLQMLLQCTVYRQNIPRQVAVVAAKPAMSLSELLCLGSDDDGSDSELDFSAL